MKKVLFVAYYFPPVAATGAMRPLGFCRYLEEYGWRPWVLTTSPCAAYPPHPIDEQLLAKLPGDVKVEVVPYIDPLEQILTLRNYIRSRLSGLSAVQDGGSKKQISQVESKLSTLQKMGTMASIKQFVLDWIFLFPDRQRAWIPPVLRHFDYLRRDEYPDAVFATGGPWTSLIVGQLLAKRFGVPFIADFRDPWASNAHLHFTSHYLLNKSTKLERSVCASAACVIANTEELRSKFVSDYPELKDKCVAITNGCHRQDFEILAKDPLPENMPIAPSESRHQQGIELCHFGTVYLMRTPSALLRAVVDLLREGKICSQQLRLRFVGMWEVGNDGTEDLAQELEKHAVLKRDPPVSHQQCLREMVKADALLILQPSSTLQIPGKIYEYIATGRPLLVIGDQGATENLVESQGLGRFCRNDVCTIKDLLLRIVNGSVKLHRPPNSAVGRFDYHALTGKLVSVLNSACSI